MPWVVQEIAMRKLGRLEILPLLFFKALSMGVTSNITPIVKGGASNAWVESHDASNEISQVEACL
jgi:hypothetical protein